jgi:hypothetical protein
MVKVKMIEQINAEAQKNKKNNPTAESLKQTCSDISQDYGKCNLCGAKLIPFDGGGGAYCPNGCQIY